MSISITLLSASSDLRTLLNQLDPITGFSDYCRSVEAANTYFFLANGGSASSAIECFERCCTDAGVVAIVVRELTEWQVFIPLDLRI